MSDSTLARDLAFGDLERELTVTRRVLERVPAEHFAWKPHPKSMSLGTMAIHVALLPEWMKDALDRDVLDFKTAPRAPTELKTILELLALFDRNAAALRSAVAAFDLQKMNDTWTMKNGDQLVTSQPRIKVYRVWSANHLIHHRGQLSLYLRLLEVRVPVVYFNTADDPAFIFE